MPNDELTTEKLLFIWNTICPPLYYSTMENIERGKVARVEATKYAPEFIVCNPQDVEFINQNIIGRRLVLLENYEMTMEEFTNNIIRLNDLLSRWR